MLNLENSIYFHTDEGDIGKDSIGNYQANLDSFVKVLREEINLNAIEDYYLEHFYQKEHINFLLQQNDSCSTKSVVSVLLSKFHISTSPSATKTFQALKTTEKGYQLMDIQVVIDNTPKSKYPLVEAILLYLEQEYPNSSVSFIDNSTFPDDFVVFEAKHPQLRKVMKIGIIYCKENQSNSIEMFSNTPADCSERFTEFLSLLGIEACLDENWKKYRGDARHPTYCYYDEWNGIEIIFHISSHFSAEEKRRLLGNDIALIYFFDSPIENNSNEKKQPPPQLQQIQQQPPQQPPQLQQIQQQKTTISSSNPEIRYNEQIDIRTSGKVPLVEPNSSPLKTSSLPMKKDKRSLSKPSTLKTSGKIPLHHSSSSSGEKDNNKIIQNSNNNNLTVSTGMPINSTYVSPRLNVYINPSPILQSPVIQENVIIDDLYDNISKDKLFNANNIESFGLVPQIYAVVQPEKKKKDDDETRYRFSFFSRSNIPHFAPPIINGASSLPPQLLKNILLAKLYNGLVASSMCPPLDRLFFIPRRATLAEIVSKHTGDLVTTSTIKKEKDSIFKTFGLLRKSNSSDVKEKNKVTGQRDNKLIASKDDEDLVYDIWGTRSRARSKSPSRSRDSRDTSRDSPTVARRDRRAVSGKVTEKEREAFIAALERPRITFNHFTQTEAEVKKQFMDLGMPPPEKQAEQFMKNNIPSIQNQFKELSQTPTHTEWLNLKNKNPSNPEVDSPISIDRRKSRSVEIKMSPKRTPHKTLIRTNSPTILIESSSTSSPSNSSRDSTSPPPKNSPRVKNDKIQTTNNDNIQKTETNNNDNSKKKINVSKFTSSFDLAQYCAHVSRDVIPEEKNNNNNAKLLELDSDSGDDSIEFSVVDIEFQLKVAEELQNLPGSKLISLSEGSLPENEKIALSNAFKLKLSGSDCSERVETDRKSNKKSKIIKKHHK